MTDLFDGYSRRFSPLYAMRSRMNGSSTIAIISGFLCRTETFPELMHSPVVVVIGMPIIGTASLRQLSHISPLVWDIATIDMLDHELGIRRTSRAHVEQSKPGSEGAIMDKEILILC